MRPTLSFIVLAIVAVGCSKPNGPAGQGGGPGGPRSALVYVDQVVEKEVTPTTEVVGTIVAKRSSIVASGADGKVNKLLVREGDFVEEGTPLSVLNMVTTQLGIDEAERVLKEREQMALEMSNGSRPEEVTKAEAQMEATRVTMEVTRRKWERQARLGQNNAVNQDDLDDSRERALAAQKLFESSQANYKLVKEGPRAEVVAQAQARLEAQQKQVAFLLAEKEKRTTKAPFRGTIVEEFIEDGEWLSKGSPVVTIANLDEVHVIANVDQLEINNVRLGSTVTVEIDAAKQREWTGVVEAIVPRSDWKSGSRTFPVKVMIQNRFVSSGERNLPVLTEGMYARVKFTGEPRDAVLVPKNAVIRSESGSRVVAVIPGEEPNSGKAKPVVITEGNSFEEYVEVLSGDLPAGSEVVTEGAERLSPFADITITQPDIDGPENSGKPTTPKEESPSKDQEQAE